MTSLTPIGRLLVASVLATSLCADPGDGAAQAEVLAAPSLAVLRSEGAMPPLPPGAPPSPSAFPPRVWLEGLPDSNQMNGYTCGVAIFEAIAMRFRIEIGQETLARVLGATPTDGTHPARMTQGFRELGLEATLVENMTVEQLKAHMDRHDIVIVDFQAWGRPAFKDYAKEWEDGHYGIAAGYDDLHLFVEDPAILGSIGYLLWPDFEARWHDYENESGGRREYHHMAIVVRGTAAPPPRVIPIE